MRGPVRSPHRLAATCQPTANGSRSGGVAWLRQSRSALRRSSLSHGHGQAIGARMHGSAPWKTEETIVGLTRLLVLSLFSRSDSPDLVAVTFHLPVSTASPFPPHVRVSTATLPTSWQVGPRQSGPHESRNRRRPTPSGEPDPSRRDLHGRNAPGYTEGIWAENRATRGRHPSADPGAKTGEDGTMTPCLSLSGLVRNRKSTSLNPENSISRLTIFDYGYP